MTAYSDFAYVYDTLMHGDIDYEKWADYIENIFSYYDISPDLVCDLACGTGNMTIPLSRRGYDMTGIDLSENMLNIAREKAANDNILFLNQNIVSLDLYGTMGAFTCMIDGINYIISPKSLYQMLKKIKTCFLDPHGIFIFDISSHHKLKNIISNNTFIHNGRDVFYSWQNRFIDGKNLSDMYLNFFVRGKSGYKRFEERHLQKAYTAEELMEIIRRAGFAKVDTYEPLTFDKPKENSQRIVFVCR